MPKFIWKATDSNGQEVVQRINATDSAQAREELAARGLKNLRLQQEELAEAGAQGVLRASNPAYAPELSAEDEAAYFDGKIPGFWRQWGKSIKANPLWEIIWTSIAGWYIYRGAFWWAIIAVTPLFLFPVLRFWFGMPGRLYDQINRAKVWSRWPDVLALANRLEQVQRWIKIGVPAWEIARCRAQALAGMGRLDEGIKEYERFASDPALAQWMYYSHLAGIYDVAKKVNESLALRIKASDEMPSNMTVWIDLSMHYAHRLGNLQDAQSAFARIDESLVPELARPYLEIVQGMMLCLEAKFAAARPRFDIAIQGLAAYRHNPLIQSVVLLAKSYLCLSCANGGETAQALHLWNQVKPYLEAAREDKLAAKIRLALGAMA